MLQSKGSLALLTRGSAIPCSRNSDRSPGAASMEKLVEEYVGKTLRLLDLEREAEVEETRSLQRRLSPVVFTLRLRCS
jgi:hypothetical protein